MGRNRTSPIWAISRSELVALVEQSVTLREVLAHFGLKSKGSNSKTIHKRCSEDGVDLSKFKKNYGVGQLQPRIPIEEMLVENSSHSRVNLKRRLLKEGLLEEKCRKCGQGNEWQGEPLVLVLDHINGVSDDNRLDNLRLLCPNCNSQTSTFAGRQNKGCANGSEDGRPKGHTKDCPNCGDFMHKNSALCIKCKPLSRRKVADRPSREQLEAEIAAHGYEATGRKYSVSGSAVRKWLK